MNKLLDHGEVVGDDVMKESADSDKVEADIVVFESPSTLGR
jgi:hypothetical protein